jgi:Tfp pilus assembly protein PilF
MNGSGSWRTASGTWICVSLLLLVASAFARIGSHDFVSYDDPQYLFQFPQVREGLDPRGIGWAFGATFPSNWHPLTWISHMIDWELYGDWAGGHHLTSLALHATSAILLFLALERLSAARWSSAFVAAVFAVHPMQVESVAWAAERKNVLSGLFWMLSLLSYARFVESRSAASYASLLVAHALGLMSKPMGVTLPFVLLLLDYWPLGRLRVRGTIARAVGRRPLEPRRARALLLEKLPLFALSAASSAITLGVQHAVDVRTLAEIPIDARIGNAIVAYAWYVAKTLRPSDLAVLYLHPTYWPLRQVLGSLLALALIALAVVRGYRRHPYLLVGWLWFGVTLLPVIGLVQVGYQSFADRYAYLPTIGLSMMVAWGVPPLAARWRFGLRALGGAAAASIGVLALATHAQVRVWRDTGTLWTHAIEVESDNYVAHANLGSWLTTQGRVEQGLEHARQAARIAPEDAHSHYNLGALLLRARDAEGAEQALRRALAIQPEHETARIELARALDSLGRRAEAVAELEVVLAATPEHAAANEYLGSIREREGDAALAMRYYRRSLATEPGQPFALRRVARILATARDPALRNADEAVRLAEQACRQSRDSDPRDLDTLAAAYALAGRADEAVATARRAAGFARRSRQPGLAAGIAKRAAVYAAGGTWVE